MKTKKTKATTVSASSINKKPVKVATTPDAVATLVQKAILESVELAGTEGVTGGTIFGALMTFGINLEQYEYLMQGLVGDKKLKKKGQLYFSLKPKVITVDVNSDDPVTEIEKELTALRTELEEMEKPSEEPEPTEVPKKAKKEKVEGEKKAKKPVSSDDLVTARDIADQAGVEPRILRRTLRKLHGANKIEAREGRWEWERGSKDIEIILNAMKRG